MGAPSAGGRRPVTAEVIDDLAGHRARCVQGYQGGPPVSGDRDRGHGR